MPWTEESDPPSPSTASAGRAPDAQSPDAARLGDAPPETPQPKPRPQTVGQRRPGPWGASPGRRLGDNTGPGPGPAPPPARPDLDRILRKVRARMSDVLHSPVGGRLRQRVLIGALVGFVAGWAASGIYQVRPGEQAVITRLRAVEGVSGPGLHAHLPWPLEQAQILATARVNTLMLSGASDDGSQALTPTADGDLVEVAYGVQWRIADPVAYLFGVDDPQDALKLAAETAMRQAVGAASLAEVLGADQGPLQRKVAAAIRQRLNRLDAGIAVTAVSIEAVRLPSEVRAAAGDVVVARQDAQAAMADADAYRARILAEAKATAAKTIIEAQSYRDQTIAEAKGAAARFQQLDAAYRKAPGVTKDRLYFETLQGVLSRAHTIVLDAAKGTTVALPPDLLRPAPPRAPSPSTGASTSSGDKP